MAEKKFNKISDLMDRHYFDPKETGPRKRTEYRGQLREQARIAYRIAKKSLRDIQRAEEQKNGDDN